LSKRRIGPMNHRWASGLALLGSLTQVLGCDAQLGGEPIGDGAPEVMNPGGGGHENREVDPESGAASIQITGGGVAIGGDPNACDGGVSVGFGGLRRVTRLEYNNLVQELFAESRDVASSFSEDGKLGNFSVNVEFPVSELQVQQYFEVGESVAAQAAGVMGEWMPCDASTQGEDECARETIESLGKRTFRRPLSDEEVEKYFGVYSGAKEGASYEDGIRVLLEAMLNSPYFLYHLEFGLPDPGAPGVIELSPFEVASRLSFFFWRGAPDLELMAAAEAGELSTPEQIEVQALRMVNHARAAETVRTFHREWLHLKTPPAGDEHEALMAAANADTLLTAEDLILAEGGTLSELFTVSSGFLNDVTSDIYGSSIDESGREVQGYKKTELNASERSGLLARAGFLNSNSPPTGRGKFIREEVLCGYIPPPPPTVDPALPEPIPGANPRDQWLAHVENASCGTCHRLMDPLGFAFDHYDEEGRWRDSVVAGENTWPVQDDGEIVSTSDIDGQFDGGQELQARLSESVDTRACFTFQWMRFATGREPSNEDACSLYVANDLFAQSGYNIRELMLAVTKTDAFRFRKTQGESQ